MVRSPVEICFGTRPSQAAKSRPLENASPLPIAATVALEILFPFVGMQGAVYAAAAINGAVASGALFAHWHGTRHPAILTPTTATSSHARAPLLGFSAVLG